MKRFGGSRWEERPLSEAEMEGYRRATPGNACGGPSHSLRAIDKRPPVHDNKTEIRHALILSAGQSS
jgi:hypothetical protein